DLERVTSPGKGEINGSQELLQDEGGQREAPEPNDDVDASSEEGVPSKWGLVLQRLSVLGKSFSDILGCIRVFLLRLLELHVLKLVALYIIWVALQEVSVMNLLLVVLWAFAVPYSRFRHMASCLSTIWACIIVVCKMLYQLKIVNPEDYDKNCSLPLLNETNLQPEEIGNSTLYQGPVDPANWFGIRKGYPSLGYIQNHLQVLVLLVFEAVVYRCQEYYRKKHQLVPPLTQTVFEDATRQNLDQGLLNCIKYFINYFFYKFGLEICFLVTVNVIGQRMNFMVIFHGCWLVVILTRRRRQAIAKLWSKYCLFLALFFIFQYLLCVGIPPVLCIDYPWRWSPTLPITSVLIKWMYFPDFFMKPNSINLMSDFLLLLCASQQWKVFVNEQTEEWVHLAGDNREHLEPLQGQPNPVPNFVNCRSHLDIVKVCVFRYLFWFVLVVVFIAGANRISIFGLGYLMACFYLLLFGTAMLRWSLRARLILWDCLILYNVTVIIAKNMLSLLSCVFVQQMQNNFCWVIQLFSLACTVKGYYDPKDVDKNQDCALPVEEAGIIWDSICFIFLLLQRRVFLSCYFLHVWADLKASALQASRGFALFKARMIKQMTAHHQAEKKSLVQLKRQMQRIRAKQEKYHQGQLARDSGEATEAATPASGAKKDPGPQGKRWWRPWLDHATVLHSGDYFLFETDSEEDEEPPVEDPKPPKQSAFQLAYQAWVTSTRTVLRKRQEEEERRTDPAEGGSSPGEEAKGEILPGGLPEERHSQEEEEEEEEEEETSPGKSNVLQRILNALRFLWVLCQATVDGLTRWLRALTKDHEHLSTILGLERFVLTQQLDQAEEVQRGILDRLYQPATPADNTSQDTALPGTAAVSPNSMASRCVSFEELEESELFYRSQNRFVQLLVACYHFVAGHSDLLCYFIIILNNMVTASVISIVLPILVFLWAMLSIPRPSKSFWMTAIVYTEVGALLQRAGSEDHVSWLHRFRLVPFLVELRAVMDWVWTDTTLSLSNWMCVEDIYANIFIIKCSRETEKKYPQPKGQKKKKIVKYGMGGLIILFLICIIWFPLLFMSLVRSVVGVVNHPIDVTVTLKLGGYEPLFTMSAQQQSIQPFTPQNYEQLTNKFEREPLAMQFITQYGYEDVAWARIEGSSGSLWSISPPSREQLWQELHNGSSDITLRFTWNFQRDLSKGGKTEYTSQKHTMDLNQKSLVRQNLAAMLQGTHHAPVRIPHLFPPYIRAPSGPEADPVGPLLPDGEDSYLDVEVQLQQQRVRPGNSSTSFLEWWMIQLADCQEECHILPMVIFSDKVSPPSLGFLAGYGIMGLYVSIVLVIGKFVRGFFSEISHSIMFEELPCVDRILTLCSHIFLVRETGELELEEELYAKLIFLYRSPETMIKWTREKD
ncbi:PREDICTED: piezo-type mechanosensitive ion channel component 1-like, partial [Thamnophis sirtalis]|uniref:Piezo-type mechanosensitive ion channel component 1-like n=1 Tax=Thamnophis sirtalis TaxID=35019 RepID=A0A6I9YAV6_9SAUR